ncbi:hypothetical protein F442_08322 [Phytophthora nicotianae P10297]|uniref:Uncharacterized protein n=1 Tax=Phytophthora nicotianae P10297 TaxID=1317064 RepID=W2ZD90_PHYNI|nr:hypothetical protein F442_08322 [Phytophthora nicotianae P10297]
MDRRTNSLQTWAILSKDKVEEKTVMNVLERLLHARHCS